jgi:threonine aldolase
MTPLQPGYSFASDNVDGAAPEILEALLRANAGQARPYGADELTARMEARLAEIFERDVGVLLVTSGTAANALSLASLTPPWGSVLCHRDAHIHSDECGAPGFFTGGAQLRLLGGSDARIDLDELSSAVRLGRGDVHASQPSSVSVTQITEAGTVYSLDQLRTIGRIAHDAQLLVHMDGARFANAIVSLGCTPAQMTWKAGIDVLSFGATKNGAPGVEAIVCFDRSRVEELQFRRKRAGQLASKMRFLAAQMDAYLADDLWLRNAAHANAMAARLATGLAVLEGVSLASPVAANMLFVRFPAAVAQRLLDQGLAFYPDRRDPSAHRLVTSFATLPEAVDAFIEATRAACAITN